MKRSRKEKLIAAAVFAAFGGVMYIKNRFMPKYADDYPYSFIWEGEEHGNLAYGKHRFRRVKTAGDLIRSQISHYKTWDGRTIAESLVQLFLIPDNKKIFDAANTAVLLSQLAICYSLGTKRKGGRLKPHKKALMLVAGFWACAPHFAATCVWLTGSMNYLWEGVLQSLFVLQYARRYHDRSYKIPAAGAALLGLLAGWSTETGAGAALMLSAMELYFSKTHKESGDWMTAGFAGLIAGFLLLMLAPGNSVKYETEKDYSNTLPEDIDVRFPGYVPPEYLYTPYMFKSYFMEGFLPTVLRELPLHIPVLVYLMNKQCRTAEADLYIAALESAAWAVPTVMMFSPEYPLRAAYPSVVYLLAATLYALEQTGTDVSPYDRGWFRVCNMMIGAAQVVSVVSSLLVDADFYCQMSDQIKALKEADRQRELVLPAIIPAPVYSFLAGDRSIDLINCVGMGCEESYDPYNEATAAYHGTGAFRVDYDADRPYEDKSMKVVINQLVQPVKSVIRRVSDMIQGIDTA